jgi:hypothetical protein
VSMDAHGHALDEQAAASVVVQPSLRKVLKLPLIVSFAGVVALGILMVGYLFNIVL